MSRALSIIGFSIGLAVLAWCTLLRRRWRRDPERNPLLNALSLQSLSLAILTIPTALAWQSEVLSIAASIGSIGATLSAVIILVRSRKAPSRD